MTRRVVITGIGLNSPIGNDLDSVLDALSHDRHGIRSKPEWDAIPHLNTRLAAEVEDVDLRRWPRQKVRAMGRVALLATDATEKAIADSGLPTEVVTDLRTGLAYGSTQGSTSSYEDWARHVFSGSGLKGIQSSAYLKFMSHTCAANLAAFFGVRGRIHTTCSACVSSSQAIGYGFESIKFGLSDVMICGGAEEMHFTHPGTFDLMYATSTRFNESPSESPRPFDRARDGLVVGEGAGTLVLEELEHAKRRGARIHAELLGFGTNCDGSHMTNPSSEGMAGAMRLALESARLPPDAVGYVNAHATATEVGDIAESLAIHAVYGSDVPVSSTKGFTGHTLGACGAIEAAFVIGMMQKKFLAPNRNLHELDPRCADLRYVKGDPMAAEPRVVASNNFAFGGLNTSLIFGRI